MFAQGFYLFDSLANEGVHCLVAAVNIFVGDIKKALLCFVQKFKYIGAFFVGIATDVTGGAYEFAQNIFFGNNTGISFYVGTTTDAVGELGDIKGTSYFVEFGVFAELFCHRQNINRLWFSEQILNSLINMCVRFYIKTIRLQNIYYYRHSIFVEHHCSQHSLFHIAGLGLYFIK